MPIYEYKCLGCGEEFELIVRSDTTIACESCGTAKVERKLSAFAVGRSSGDQPSCAPACGAGFSEGRCGTGCCGGRVKDSSSKSPSPGPISRISGHYSGSSRRERAVKSSVIKVVNHSPLRAALITAVL